MNQKLHLCQSCCDFFRDGYVVLPVRHKEDEVPKTRVCEACNKKTITRYYIVLSNRKDTK